MVQLHVALPGDAVTRYWVIGELLSCGASHETIAARSAALITGGGGVPGIEAAW